MNSSARPGRVDRDELLSRVDLENLLDNLTGPQSLNRRWHCPDVNHPDQHPSVTVRVDPDGVQRWRCWSGGHRGTAIDAVMVAHGVDVGTALRWLAEHHTNLPVVHRPLPPPAAPVGRPHRSVLDYVDRAATLIWTPAGEQQRLWLSARGLGVEVLRANRVGADPGRRFLPRDKGFPAGWPAVVYPALDPAGQVTYFQARYLSPPHNRCKYDNPASQHAANPRLAWTVPVGEPRPGVLVACEGTADALIAAQAGFRSVAVLGAAYPDARIADNIADTISATAALSAATVAVCFDSDEPGRRGGARLAELLSERGITTRFAAVPDGLDLTEWARHDPGWAGTLAPPAAASLTPCPPAPTPAGPELGVGLGLSIDGFG